MKKEKKGEQQFICALADSSQPIYISLCWYNKVVQNPGEVLQGLCLLQDMQGHGTCASCMLGDRLTKQGHFSRTPINNKHKPIPKNVLKPSNKYPRGKVIGEVASTYTRIPTP